MPRPKSGRKRNSSQVRQRAELATDQAQAGVSPDDLYVKLHVGRDFGYIDRPRRQVNVHEDTSAPRRKQPYRRPRPFFA